MRGPAWSAANASRARKASAAAMPENSTHAAPASAFSVLRESSALRAATDGGVTATMRTSSRLRSRAAKSAFSAAPESHRWAPTARIASSRRKKSSRDTRLGGFAGDEEQPVEHDIFVECVRQGKVWRDFMRGPAGKDDAPGLAAMFLHALRHARDRAHACVDGPGGDRIGGGHGKIGKCAFG